MLRPEAPCRTSTSVEHLGKVVGRSRSSSQAFLIRQKSTGEEIVVAMRRLPSPIKTPRTVVSRVPTYLSSGRFVPALRIGGVEDDSRCDYKSLLTRPRPHPSRTRARSHTGLGSVEEEQRDRRLEVWQAEHRRRRQRSVGGGGGGGGGGVPDLAALNARSPRLVNGGVDDDGLLVPDVGLLVPAEALRVEETISEPEKERRRMVGIVSCVAVAITGLAAALVALTLGLSHLLEEPGTGWPGGSGRGGWALNASLFLSGRRLNNSDPNE